MPQTGRSDLSAPIGRSDPPRIGVLVVAYNAEDTLAATLDRIPTDFHAQIDEILICDDASQDATFEVGTAWRDQNPSAKATVVRHRSNLGYGGNQIAGYQLAIERGLDIVVLLHGDGQYAPECLPDMIAPLARGECDAVFGSRMITPGAARAGGMPAYKYIGNRLLTKIENSLLGTELSEFHSGYRAYSVAALESIPFERNTYDFDFDTQIIVQLLDAGKRIVEIPIPTYYGDEICYVNGLKYARDVVGDVVKYRLSKVGIGAHPWVPQSDEYDIKDSECTSHTTILGMLEQLPPGRVLDLGCSGGRFAEMVRGLGFHVTGVDSIEVDGVRDRVDRFVLGNLEGGIPAEVGRDFDYVILADVIEHCSRPEEVLQQVADVLAPTGQALISTPNFAHWYPRTRSAFGVFDYDRRGILDKTHLRFFTRRSFLNLLRQSRYAVEEFAYTGLPFDVISDGQGKKGTVARKVDRGLVRARPTLFAYQFVARVRPRLHGRPAGDPRAEATEDVLD
ncbi:bifunctional glycosyltransferase/class I SAM-dependent methyltransferase [Sporichthya sp.]|uniref:bifunctional glycosyltransferase/class I SAM-dependent methyltransferase n=1 Tax=Sporichthya sp. TaxID=65475 RepID=UPI00181FF09F|nr:bifunctional glycosyltransferase/class I SAM-dependent methyltransferase [Sporichthya sp.]MBA3743431.1 glycosyltransferase [Sporichthya sp.]